MNDPDLVFEPDERPIDFGRTFVTSDAFRALFEEGMELIEDTAAYLDGPGREDAKRLPRRGTLAYASETMRLTTRLMQVASWLLLQRAVAEGEITADQARAEKHRVRLGVPDAAAAFGDFDALPSRLRELIGLSSRLHARILHLDELLSERAPPPVAPDNPVALQRRLLQRAFAGSPD